jgi:hypothetical protein
MDLSETGDVFVPVVAAPLVASIKWNFFGNGSVTTEDGAFSPVSWLRIVGQLKPGVTPIFDTLGMRFEADS